MPQPKFPFTQVFSTVQIKKNEGQIDRTLSLPPWILKAFFLLLLQPYPINMSMLYIRLNSRLYSKLITSEHKLDLSYIPSCTGQCLEQNRDPARNCLIGIDFES